MLAVAALIALRLALGCHFLYEGVWKIKHHDEFTAEPFLTQAKGPISPLFYAMIPDIDGRQQLALVEKDGKPSLDPSEIADRWEGIEQDFVAFYNPGGSAEGTAKTAHEKLQRDATRVREDFCKKLNDYMAENTDAVVAHFGSLDRFENDAENAQGAPYQKQRRWDRMMELRREAGKWVKDLEDQEKAFKNSLYALLTGEQRELGRPSGSWNPFCWNRVEQINFAVTYALTAIGICLMLGFFTPLAALGGACFMFFVVMTQPAFPGIYPPDPPVVGHALLINKDFVEAVSLLVVAAASAGRWGGLDYFLYHWIINPFLARRNKKQA